MQKNEFPTIEINGLYLDENCYKRGDESWDCSTLIEYVKRKDYQTFDLPLAAILLHFIPWDMDNMRDVIHHMARVNAADLSHPIILDDYGQVADGWHRIVLALISGKQTIKAIRIMEMPQCSGKNHNAATN